MGRMKAAPMNDALALLDKIPPKFAALAALGIATGGRISELLALRRADLIDAQKMKLRREIKLVQKKTRRRPPETLRLLRDISARLHGREAGGQQEAEKPSGEKYRRFPIPESLHPYISAHLNAEAEAGHIRPTDYVFRGRAKGRPLSTRAAYAGFTRLMGAGYGTHWLRKTYARYSYAVCKKRYKGDNWRAAREVQRLLGHKSIDTTARYLADPDTDTEKTIAAEIDRAKEAQRNAPQRVGKTAGAATPEHTP